jgi:hypothetical protein
MPGTLLSPPSTRAIHSPRPSNAPSLGQLAGAVDLALGAVAGEPGDVEVTVVEQPQVVPARGLAAAAAHPARRDELVDVVEALVVTHVGDDPAVVRDGDGRALVLEPAERRALAGREVGSYGSTSTTQPKRFGSFGSLVRSKRGSTSSHLRSDAVAAFVLMP